MTDSVMFLLGRVEPRVRRTGPGRSFARIVGPVDIRLGVGYRFFGVAWEGGRLLLHVLTDGPLGPVPCLDRPVDLTDTGESITFVDDERSYGLSSELVLNLERPRAMTPDSAATLLSAALRARSAPPRAQTNLRQRALGRWEREQAVPEDSEPRSAVFEQLRTSGFETRAPLGEERTMEWRSPMWRSRIVTCAAVGDGDLEQELRLCLGTVLRLQSRYTYPTGTGAFLVAAAGRLRLGWTQLCARAGVALVQPDQLDLLQYPWPQRLRERGLMARSPAQMLEDRFRARRTFQPGIAVEDQFQAAENWGGDDPYRIYLADGDEGALIVHAIRSGGAYFAYDVQVFDSPHLRLRALWRSATRRLARWPMPRYRELGRDWGASFSDVALVSETEEDRIYSASDDRGLLLILEGPIAHHFAAREGGPPCASGVLALEFASIRSRRAVIRYFDSLMAHARRRARRREQEQE